MGSILFNVCCKEDYMELIELCITSKCNLRCKHCYQQNDKNVYELPYEKIVEALNYAIQSNCQTIVISGGEACLHPHYYEVINYIINNSDCTIRLVTNGTILDLNYFEQFGLQNRVEFVISIDGCEENHDIRRGAGNYKKTIASVLRLEQLYYKVFINVTLDEDNFNDFENIINNPLFKSINFLPVGFAGAAVINKKESLNRDYEYLIKTLYTTVDNEFGSCRECKLYPKSLSINYDGTVYPCSLARDFHAFPMGNINADHFDKIIESFNLTDNAILIEGSHHSKLDTCAKCSLNTKCSKGCRIRAYKFGGSLTDPDPFACKLRGKGYKNISYAKLYWGEKN